MKCKKITKETEEQTIGNSTTANCNVLVNSASPKPGWMRMGYSMMKLTDTFQKKYDVYRIIDLHSASLRITIQRRSQHENPREKETSSRSKTPIIIIIFFTETIRLTNSNRLQCTVMQLKQFPRTQMWRQKT